MQIITIQGIDDSPAEKMKQAAEKEPKNINELILHILKECLDTQEEKKTASAYHDLDHLFGSWSDEEFSQIQNRIDGERKTDPEHWSLKM